MCWTYLSKKQRYKCWICKVIQSQMSDCPQNHLSPSSFINHLSTFKLYLLTFILHFLTFKLFILFFDWDTHQIIGFSRLVNMLHNSRSDLHSFWNIVEELRKSVFSKILKLDCNAQSTLLSDEQIKLNIKILQTPY